jgi:predicted transport protein
MPLFRISDGKFQRLKPRLAAKERNLQDLIEANLLEALDVHFLAREYTTTTGGRIDTLGVDRTGAPTIIEYKRNQNDNVINQSLSYLRWLKHQKSEFFEMLMAKRLPKELINEISLDWENPRVICIAENFSRFDIDTSDIVPIKIELMVYRFYENDVFSLEFQSVGGREREPLTPLDKTHDPGGGDLIDVHLRRGSDEINGLFENLRAQVKALGPDVVERPTTVYIGYRASKNFLEVHIQKHQLKLYLRPVDYEDPEGRISKIDPSYRWTLDRLVLVKNSEELDYAMKLIILSYKDVS